MASIVAGLGEPARVRACTIRRSAARRGGGDPGILGLPAFLAALLVLALLAARRGIGDARMIGVASTWPGVGVAAASVSFVRSET